MRLPDDILSSLRGPLVAATLSGCAAAAEPVAIAPEPLTPVPFAAPPTADPVTYDEAAEAARLSASDEAVGADAARRGTRIATNVARARALAAPRVPVNRPPDWGRVRCGRG